MVLCWGGNISEFDRGRLAKIVKKKRKKAGHVMGRPLDSVETLSEEKYTKNVCRY